MCHVLQNKNKHQAILNIDNSSKCFLSSKSSIRMISERSCDPEDCWKSSYDHRNTVNDILTD